MSYFLLGKINHDKKCYKFVKKMLKKGSQTPKFMIRLYLYWGSGTLINRVRYLNPQGTIGKSVLTFRTFDIKVSISKEVDIFLWLEKGQIKW